MADITLPDGTRIPEYALETTQAEIMKLLSAQVKADDKTFKLYEKMVKAAKDTADSNEDQEKIQEEQIKLLHGIREDAKTGKNTLGKGLNFIADKMVALGTGAVSVAVTGLAFFAKSAYNLGNTLADLGQVGIGLDGTGQAAVNTMSSLQRLGMSATASADLMRNSGEIIAAIGQKQFVAINAEISSMTSAGAKFGLTMTELANVAAEDLETRQRLGIMDGINANQAAQRSTELYGQQLKATKLLGKSITDIRDASRNTVDSAEFALTALSMGADAARQFTTDMQEGLGGLFASGVDQSIVDMIGKNISQAVAFGGEDGAELFSTLSVIDNKLGTGLTSSIEKMNQLAKTDPSKVGPELEKFQQKMRSAAAAMSEEDFKEYAAFLQSGALGQTGQAMALSLGQMRRANERYTEVFGDNADNMISQFDGLAKGSKTFDNAMAQLKGGFSGLTNDLAGALGPTVGSLAEAFADTEDGMGISTAFKVAMTDVSKALQEVFGGDGEVKNIGQRLREYVVPALQEFGKWFKEGNGAQKIKDALINFKDLVVGITAPFRGLFNLLTGDLEGAKESIVGSFDTLAGKIGMAVGAFVILNKTIGGAKAGIGALGKMKGMFGGGGPGASTAGGAAGKAAGGGLGAVGKGIGKLGKGIGKGIGGVFKGLAAGISAFANPKVVLGAAGLAASILLIGGAVAGATWMMGKALPTMAEGLKSFEDIDGDNLIDVGLGMLAVGAGIAAMGAGNVVGAIGNLVGGAFDKLNELLGGPSIMDKVAEFAKWDIDVGRVENNSQALVAYGKGMGALGAAEGLAGIGNYISFISDSLVSLLGGDTPLEKVQKFSEMTFNKEAIKANADAIFEYSLAMSRLADVEVAGATITGFISDIGQGLLALFGAESPMDKLKKFGESDISAAGVKVNARAILEYAVAMSALKDVDVRDLSRATAGLMDDRSMLAFEKLKEFSELDIGAFSMRENNIAIRQYALGMKEMQEVDAKLAADNIIMLSKAYATFNLLNPERLIAVAEGMAAINTNAINGVSLGSMDTSVAISTGLADLKPSTSTASTGLADLKAGTSTPSPTGTAIQPPLLPGEKPVGATETSSEDTSASVAALLKKNNQKLDELIQAVNRQA